MGIVGIICLILALGLSAWGACAMKHNHLELHPRTQTPSIAVLIPARDESAVIEGILGDLARQTVKIEPKDIYVIVESLDDPTVKICRERGCEVVLRKDLSKQSKGYALDDAVKEILVRKRYDLYFIFDADNLLAPDFVEQMLKSYAAGFEIVTSYRALKNGDANVVAAASGLTFAMINLLCNRQRVKHRANIVFSGTGLFVDGKLIDEWRGWPFHSLTEDYEISLYATLHGLATFYNEDAVFYDEQPTRYRQTVAQRRRWIKGYFTTRKHYIPLMRMKRRTTWNHGSLVKERIGVKAVIALVIGVVLLVLDGMFWLIYSGHGWWALALLVAVVLLVYVILVIITVVLVRSEKLNITSQMKRRVVLFNPFYLVTYVPCALEALLSKDVAWQKIEHGKNS